MNSLVNQSSQAWKRVQQVHTKLADFNISTIKGINYKGDDHIKIGITNKNTGQTATVLIDADYNLVIDDTDQMDAFSRVLNR